MVRRRRRNNLQWILYGGLTSLVVGLLIVVVVLLALRNRGGSDAALHALADASEEREAAKEDDPWANLDKDAIQRVKRTATSRDGGQSIDQLLFANDLRERVTLYKELDLGKGKWTARRVSGETLYWVTYENVFYGVTIGPKWLVQMDKEGRTPEKYANGVIPANALATILMTDAPNQYGRYLNRTDAVLDVLLKHTFDSGLPLSSSMLIYFAGRNRQLKNTELIGWAVIPQRVEIGGDVVYDAFFQWRERDRLQIAHFEVDLQKNRFEARNLLANTIVAEAAEMEDEVVDIRPQSLKDNRSPARESDPMIRSLRYILHNEQLISSVGALLSFRAQTSSFSYDGWRIEPDGCHDCSVIYRYREGDETHGVSWDVTSRGQIKPTSTISEMATAAISVAQPASNDDESGAN